MRNCLILGCGRSGTSMLAGTLRTAGYYMGGRLYRPREANPKGFFESHTINAINEHLLRPIAPSRSRYPFMRIWRASFPSERWLAQVPVGTVPSRPGRLNKRIQLQVNQGPFAFKDPRFCYTLPAWRPHLPAQTVFLCIFREPGRTVASILTECHKQYPDITLTRRDAFQVWNTMYRHVLDVHRRKGDWLFLHYDQVLDGSAVSAIETHLRARVDGQFPDASLKRAPLLNAPKMAMQTYEELCTLAGYEPPI